MRNLLVVVDYLPGLRDGLLQLMVNQMMKIDVSVLCVCIVMAMCSVFASVHVHVCLDICMSRIHSS